MDYERQSGDDAGTEPNGSADEETDVVAPSGETPGTGEPAQGDGASSAAAETGGDSAPVGADEAATSGDTATDGEMPTGGGVATPTDGETAATDATSTDTGTDFDSDADVMNDAFETAPKPPEWPAADLERSLETSAADEGSVADAIAATYAAATDEETDMGDDSDAPIHLEDAPAAEPGRAETINLSRGGIQSIEASTVTLSQGGAGQVRADTMSIEQGGVGLARVRNLTLGSGSSAFAVVADHATVEEGSNTFLVVSRSFSGDVQPTIDWRGALAFGAGLGLIVSLLRRRR